MHDAIQRTPNMLLTDETDKLAALLQSNTSLTQQDKELTEQVAELTREIHAIVTKSSS